jgi:hypothetical protein
MTKDTEVKNPKLSEEAKKFNAAVDDFIGESQAGKISVPSDYNLIKFLGIKTSRFKYYKEMSLQHGYCDGFEKLKMFRENYWMEKSLENKTQTSAIFHLKQPMNGGYVDKQEKSNDPIKVEVVIAGCDNAFK